GHSRMIKGRAKVPASQKSGDLLRLAPVAGIDNGTSLLPAKDLQQTLLLVFFRQHQVGQVLPRETFSKNMLLLEAELPADILFHIGSGRGSKRQDRYLRQ